MKECRDMIDKVLYLVLVLASPGHKDKIFSEPVSDNITITQCIAQAQFVMPRMQQQLEYKGYDLKSFGCLTEQGLKDLFDKVRKQ